MVEMKLSGQPIRLGDAVAISLCESGTLSPAYRARADSRSHRPCALSCTHARPGLGKSQRTMTTATAYKDTWGAGTDEGAFMQGPRQKMLGVRVELTTFGLHAKQALITI